RPLASGLALVAAFLLASAAPAGPMGPPPSMQYRLAVADVVVTGKVVSIEEKPVHAPAYPGNLVKAEYQIAVVKIDDPILRAKGLTHIRVGFLLANPAQFRRLPQVHLTKD